MPDSTTCTCPDPWCPQHSRCRCGSYLIITDDDPAFCPECLMDVMPQGACERKYVARRGVDLTAEQMRVIGDYCLRMARVVVDALGLTEETRVLDEGMGGGTATFARLVGPWAEQWERSEK